MTVKFSTRIPLLEFYTLTNDNHCCSDIESSCAHAHYAHLPSRVCYILFAYYYNQINNFKLTDIENWRKSTFKTGYIWLYYSFTVTARFRLTT